MVEVLGYTERDVSSLSPEELDRLYKGLEEELRERKAALMDLAREKGPAKGTVSVQDLGPRTREVLKSAGVDFKHLSEISYEVAPFEERYPYFSFYLRWPANPPQTLRIDNELGIGFSVNPNYADKFYLYSSGTTHFENPIVRAPFAHLALAEELLALVPKPAVQPTT